MAPATDRGAFPRAKRGFAVFHSAKQNHKTSLPEGQSATLGARGPVKLKNPWAEGPSILRTFPSEPFFPQCHSASLHHQLEQAPIYSCSSLFQLVPACSTGTDFHLCDFMKLFQLVPSCSTACSTGFLSHHRVKQANGTSGTRYYL